MRSEEEVERKTEEVKKSKAQCEELEKRYEALESDKATVLGECEELMSG